MDVLPEDVSGQVWDLLRVELVPARAEEDGQSSTTAYKIVSLRQCDEMSGEKTHRLGGQRERQGGGIRHLSFWMLEEIPDTL